MDSEQANISLEQVLGVLRRRAPWILLCLLLGTAAAYGYSKSETKKYKATAALTFGSNQLDQQIAGLPTTSSNPVAQQANNLELVSIGNMAAQTASVLGHGLTAERVSASLSVSAQGETGIIDVAATSTSPVLAAEIANVYVGQFVRDQLRTNRQYFASALVLVKKQLAALSPQQRLGVDGLNLQDRAQTLGLLAGLHYGNVQVAQEATVPASPSSPRTTRNTALGAALGLLLGLVVAFLLERFDRRIREPEELEAIYRLPMLGIVPKSDTLAQSATNGVGAGVYLPSPEAEAFSLIRAHLRFFNVDRELRTVLVASPAQGDGKTTIARYLAEAAARSGSRALLLEVDLRRPTLAQQLGIETGPGLAGVLVGDVSMAYATRSVDLRASSREGSSAHTLDVLVAGSVLPPNPGELIESQAMDALLEQARSSYDFVVIDTPPLTAVSDAFPLLTKVDGAVIVGRVGHSSRDAAEQLHQVLASSGASLFGVIANGASSGAPSPYPGNGGSPLSVVSAGGASTFEEFVPTADA